MKLSRKQYLKLSAATIAGAMLASCKPAASPAQQPTQQSASQSPVPVEPSGEVSYLIRTDLGATQTEWTELSVKQFQEAHPNIKVNLVGVPWGDYNAKLLAMYAAGTPPEISANYAAGFATFYANDAIVAVDDFVSAHNVDLTVFDKACLDALTRNGRLWAMPLAHMPELVFYNKSLFDKAGAKLPPTDWADKSWTTDAMLEVSAQIAHDTDDPSKAEWGVDYPTGQLGVYSWLWGGDPFNDQGGPELTEAYKTGIVTEVFYTGPKVVAYHQFRRDLVYEHEVAPRPSDTDILSQTQGFTIMTGKIGMAAAGAWQFNSFVSVKPSWEWGVAPLPYGAAGKNTTPLYNDSWMLSKGCKNPEAGFQLLTYLTVGRGAEDYARITGFCPANNTYYPIFFDSLMQIPNLAMTREDLENVVKQSFKYGYVTPGKTLDRYPELNNTYTQTTAPIWNDEVSVEEGLQGVQQAFENLIKTS